MCAETQAVLQRTWPSKLTDMNENKRASAMFKKVSNLQISRTYEYVRLYYSSYGGAEGGRYSVFLLSLTTARQLYHTESLHPPRHPVKAAVFRIAIKDTPSNRRFTSCVPSYFLCANRYSSFLFAMPLQSASGVIPISRITAIQFFPHFNFLTDLSFSFAN
jgi:hypothetical protein